MQQQPRGRRSVMLAVIAGVMILSACQSGSRGFGEVRELQKQIMAKLEELTGVMQLVGAKIAAQFERRQARTGPNPATAYELPIGASPVKGPENAPVTVTEFADYECPYSARNEATIAEFMNAYPGKVRVVFKHFPIVSIHRNAMLAAKAATAAQKQGKFWEMQEKLFTNQNALGEQQIKQYAQEIGLDLAKFEADMNSPEIQKQVQDDIDLATKLQISGTPALFVNGKPIADHSMNTFRLMADEILKEKG
jgi:protein-disulfide isomerase